MTSELQARAAEEMGAQRSLNRALFCCMSRQSSWDCRVISPPGAEYIVLASLGRHFSDGLSVRLAMVGSADQWRCNFLPWRLISLPQHYRFFSLRVLSPPQPSSRTRSKKWRTTLLTALLASISAPPTRMYRTLDDRQPTHDPLRCVGVWQNDRVEIIANDREHLTSSY